MIHPPPWLLRTLDDPSSAHPRRSTAPKKTHGLVRMLARLSRRSRVLTLGDARDSVVDGRDRVGVEIDA